MGLQEEEVFACNMSGEGGERGETPGWVGTLCLTYASTHETRVTSPTPLARTSGLSDLPQSMEGPQYGTEQWSGDNLLELGSGI